MLGIRVRGFMSGRVEGFVNFAGILVMNRVYVCAHCHLDVSADVVMWTMRMGSLVPVHRDCPYFPSFHRGIAFAERRYRSFRRYHRGRVSDV